MHFPDTADKKNEDVKEAGELKAENVNKGNVKDPGELKGDAVKNAGIYNYSLINFTFCCLQCRRMRISLFQIFQITVFILQTLTIMYAFSGHRRQEEG